MGFNKLSLNERKLIVGIDFGTTYSSLAWAETKRPDRLAAITTWPVNDNAPEGESSDKVPTKLRYVGDKIEWGFSIPVTAPEEDVIDWLKMDIDPSLVPEDQARSRDSARKGRSAETLVEDYITALSSHLMYILNEKLGKGVVENIPIGFVITVPAIWSDLAKDKTRLACLQAPAIGDRPVHLVSEPEAAAMYSLHGLDPHGLKVGDTIVIIDAGGGTVDLISYTVTQLTPVMEIEEAAPGSGGLCGSTFVNRRFAMFLKSQLGHLDGFDEEVMNEAQEVFDKKILQVKRHFNANILKDESFVIPVGGLSNNPTLGISRGRYSLKASDVHNIFEPVVQEIIKLVHEQIKATKKSVTSVLLVGGFGASMYLKERLRQAIKKQIVIMQPPKAWQAIVQGAVMKGLANCDEGIAEVSVRNRRARKSYGVSMSTPFSESEHNHLAREKWWDKKDGIFRVNVMKWFITRNDQVSENVPICIACHSNRSVADGRPKELTLPILCDEANRDIFKPIQKDDRIRQLATLRGDIRYIPESQLTRKTGADGLLYYCFDCEVRATFGSASTSYSLWCKGKEYSKISCEYV